MFTYVDQAMVGDLPAGLEPQHVQGPRLLGGEVREGGVGHVIGLQPIRAQYISANQGAPFTWRLNSYRLGRSWVMAQMHSSATLMQSCNQSGIS